MATPSYKTLLENIQTLLQNSSDLSGINDNYIFIGGLTGQIYSWPAITIEITEANEEWAGTKTLRAYVTIVIAIYDNKMNYLNGIQSIQDNIQSIQDTVQANRKLNSSSLGVETSDIDTYRFGVTTYNETPLFGGELELTVNMRYTPST